MIDSTADSPSSANATPPRATGRGKWVALIAVVVAIACAAAALAYFWLTRNQVTTDNAFIQSDIVQVAPRVTGTVARVFVRDNQRVDKGAPLFDLDPADYQAALAKAEANLVAARASHVASQRSLNVTQKTSAADIERAQAALATARAEARRAGADARRYRALHDKQEVSQQQLDQANTTATAAYAKVREAKAQLDQAQTAPDQIALKESQASTTAAQISQAQAEVDQARLNLSYTRVKAPRSGQIAQKAVLPGSHVSAGQAAMAVVADNPWVVANFKETQLTRMHVGQPVAIQIDAFPDHHFSGRLQSIQAGTGPTFSLLPPQNATGNYVKVVQRVPVKIVFDKPEQLQDVDLAPGMSVEPTINLVGRLEPVAGAPTPATATTAQAEP